MVAITGTASGMGLACARRALAAGATVVLVDLAQDRLARSAPNWETGHIQYRHGFHRPSEHGLMLPGILERASNLDVFHRNAGTCVGGDVVDGDPNAWDRMRALNVNAV